MFLDPLEPSWSGTPSRTDLTVVFWQHHVNGESLMVPVPVAWPLERVGDEVLRLVVAACTKRWGAGRLESVNTIRHAWFPDPPPSPAEPARVITWREFL